MDILVNELQGILNKERDSINKKIDENNTLFLFTDMMKSVDYFCFSTYKDKEFFDPYIKYGFSYFLNRFYAKSTFDKDFLQLFKSTTDSLSFCHYWIYQYGKCESIQRMLDLVKQDEIALSKVDKKTFNFHISSKCMDEYIENKSVNDYFEIMRNYVLKEKIEIQSQKEAHVLKLLDNEVKTWRGDYIQYGSIPEIDEYYFQEGYIYMVSTQLYDDFDESFEFGGIKYGSILKVLQALIGVALKHIDACMLLLKKDPNIKFYNILSIPFCLDELYPSYSDFLDIDLESIKKIFNLFVVSSSNIEYHLCENKYFSPMFVKIGPRFVYRTIKGCLSAPVLFFHKELKRQYYKDYFKWINERELYFRNQLYSLFISERFVRIPRNVEINSKGIRTDIDAILYDRVTKTLGLFQLKWQDRYASDLKARRSRVENFYSKANEWVDKMVKWSSFCKEREILSALKIDDTKISNIYLFVLGRYNTYFSNHQTDERAAWGSWYHVVELSHKIKTNFDDPIRELFFKLKMDSPRNKNIPKESFNDANIKIGDNNITWSYD